MIHVPLHLRSIEPDTLASLVEEELVSRAQRLLQACAPRLVGTVVDEPHPRSRAFGETHRTVVGQQIADLASYAKTGTPRLTLDDRSDWETQVRARAGLLIRPLLDALVDLVAADFGGASSLFSSEADLDLAPPLDPVPMMGSPSFQRPARLRLAGRELALVFAAARGRSAIEQGWDPPARWLAALGGSTTARVTELVRVGEIESARQHDQTAYASNAGARRWLAAQGVLGIVPAGETGVGA